jgi:hypothetical protein
LRATAAGGARQAQPAAKRAFYTGIVKNQQGSATELLQISNRWGIGTAGFFTVCMEILR